jgi:hypothetical protein
MSDDKSKKPKIDLKARLGKATPSMPSASPSLPGVPPGLPSAPGSLEGLGPKPSIPGPPPSMSIAPPVGIAPPPGLVPQVSMPPGLLNNPFAPKPAPSAAPPPPKAAPVSAEAQTIKVELGEEIHEERAKANKRAIIFAAIAMFAGVGIGWVAGGSKEKSARADMAVQGAKALEVEVVDATKKIEELTPMLKEIEDGLKGEKYPTAVVGKLSSFAVPFNAASIDGKGAGNMPGKIQKQLFSFVKKCEDLEDKKNALKNILGGAQKGLETAWAEKKKPTFKLGVAFKQSGGNMLAEMVRFKEPWETSATWPKEPKIFVPVMKEGRRAEEEKGAARWEKGDLTGSSPIVIPIEPSTVAGFTDERVALQLVKATSDVRAIISGGGQPGQETIGILQEGEQLAAALGELGSRR